MTTKAILPIKRLKFTRLVQLGTSLARLAGCILPTNSKEQQLCQTNQYLKQQGGEGGFGGGL